MKTQTTQILINYCFGAALTLLCIAVAIVSLDADRAKQAVRILDLHHLEDSRRIDRILTRAERIVTDAEYTEEEIDDLRDRIEALHKSLTSKDHENTAP
jgi:hypothetical protein